MDRRPRRRRKRIKRCCEACKKAHSACGPSFPCARCIRLDIACIVEEPEEPKSASPTKPVVVKETKSEGKLDPILQENMELKKKLHICLARIKALETRILPARSSPKQPRRKVHDSRLTLAEMLERAWPRYSIDLNYPYIDIENPAVDIVLDMSAMEPIINYMSPRICTLLKRDQKQMIGSHWKANIPNELIPAFEKLLKELLGLRLPHHFITVIEESTPIIGRDQEYAVDCVLQIRMKECIPFLGVACIDYDTVVPRNFDGFNSFEGTIPLPPDSFWEM